MPLRPLAEETVRAILLDDSNYKASAKKFNLSCHTIKRIRIGITYSDIAPEIPRKPTQFDPSKDKRCLVDPQVREILRSTATVIELGKRYGVSKETIRGILKGAIYADVMPDYPRRLAVKTNYSCTNCVHFDGTTYRTGHRGPRVVHRCMLEIPEIRTSLGLKSANFCSCYMEAT